MKAIGVALLLFSLTGCGTYHTLEELEEQAMLTGDWSAVEQRERTIAKRKSRSAACPGKTMLYCESWGVSERCTCLSRETFQNTLDRW